VVDPELRLTDANPALLALAGGDGALARPLADTLPWLAEAIAGAVALVLATRAAAPQVEARPDPGGRGHRFDVTLAPAGPRGGRRAGVALVLVRRDGSDEAHARLEAVQRVMAPALRRGSLDEALPQVAHRLCEALDTDAAAVYLASDDGTRLVRRGASGLDAAPDEVPLGHGAVGRIAESRVTMVFPELSPEGTEASLVRAGIRSLVGAPLVASDRLLGVVTSGTRAPRAFGWDDSFLISLVASRLGGVLQLAALYQQAHFEQARWQATVESMLDPVAVADAAGRPIYTNAAYRRMMAPEGAGAGAAGGTLLRPDGQPFAWEDLPVQRAALRGEGIRDLEVVHRTPAGHERVSLWTASPLRDEGGRVLGAVAIGRDVTQQRRAEREREILLNEVQRQAAEKEAALTAIADGMLIYSRAGQLLYTNPAAQTLLGLTDEERGLSFADRVRALAPTTPDGRPVVPEQSPGGRALRGERVRNALLVLERAGRKLWLSTSAAPVLARGGERLGAVVTISDVTPLHELEVQRDELLRAVSHDIRTPLTLVLLHAQLLRQQHGDDTELGSADQILAAARRIDAMIEELVESSRLQAGQLELERRPVLAHTFIDEAIARAGTFLDPGRVRVQVEPDVPTIEVDPERLARVVVSLLRSAEGYSAEGAPIEVRVARAGRAVVIAVTAQGPGIPPEELPLLFDRMQRPKGAKRIEGLGLGLFIARLITEKHGGRIWAESVPGRDCTFSVSLPTLT
jgi:PAS domain S-box-containing protein